MTHTHEEPTAHYDSLATKVLGAIERQHIAPTSRSYFVVRDLALWVPGLVVTVLGIFAWAGFFFALTHATWDYGRYVHTSTLATVWDELPKVWLALFAIFAVGVTYAFKHTKRGYRYNAREILTASMLLSLTGGGALFTLDTYYRVPLLRGPSESLHRAMWSHPQEGRLAGMVTLEALAADAAADDVDAGITLVDDAHVVWHVRGIDRDFFDALPRSQGGMHGMPPMDTDAEDELFMRLIGTVLPRDAYPEPNTFLACVVLPGKMNRMPPPMGARGRPEPKQSSDTRCIEILEQIQHARMRN